MKQNTRQVLRAKFPENEYVLICEVSDASGFSRSRSLDYMLINLWVSRGLYVTGIEQKTNRSDWLKELKNPQKQENHFKHCDYFYLLTDRDGVAKLEEIPETWGWYHINDKQILKTMKPAPKLSPLPITRTLMCAMMRRAASKEGYVHVDSLASEIQQKAEAVKKEFDFGITNKAKMYDELSGVVEEFEKASGLHLRHTWEPKEMGEAVRIIMNSGVDNYRQQLESIEKRVKNIHEGIVKNIETLMLNSEPTPTTKPIVAPSAG